MTCLTASLSADILELMGIKKWRRLAREVAHVASVFFYSSSRPCTDLIAIRELGGTRLMRGNSHPISLHAMKLFQVSSLIKIMEI